MGFVLLGLHAQSASTCLKRFGTTVCGFWFFFPDLGGVKMRNVSEQSDSERESPLSVVGLCLQPDCCSGT